MIQIKKVKSFLPKMHVQKKILRVAQYEGDQYLLLHKL